MAGPFFRGSTVFPYKEGSRLEPQWPAFAELRPLLGDCPYLGGSFIRGSTVVWLVDPRKH